MAIIMMFMSAVISIVFLIDFTRTIHDLHRDTLERKAAHDESGGFRV